MPLFDIGFSPCPNDTFIFDALVNHKIDTQGFESEVLKGSVKNLRNIVGIQLEMSTVPLYQKQKTYEYFFNFLKKYNFHLWSIIPGYWNTKTGQMLQFDGIFIKKTDE